MTQPFHSITQKDLARITGIHSMNATMARALVRLAFYNDQRLNWNTVAALRNRGLATIEYHPDDRQARKDSGRADGRTYSLTPQGRAVARWLDEAVEYGIEHAATSRLTGRPAAELHHAYQAVRDKPVVPYVRPIDTNYAFDPDAAPLPIRHAQSEPAGRASGVPIQIPQPRHTDGVTFGTLEPTGQVSNVRVIRQSDIRACPFVIFIPSHYREDGSCKCDDADERTMMIREWGYSEEDFADIPLRDTTPATDLGDR